MALFTPNTCVNDLTVISEHMNDTYPKERQEISRHPNVTVNSHYTGTGLGTGQRPEIGSIGSKKLCEHVHTGPR